MQERCRHSVRESLLIPRVKRAEVGVDSTGRPIYWHAPDEFKPAKAAANESDAAQQAFTLMSGPGAPLFSAPSRSMGDDPKDEEYVWKKILPDHSEIRDQIKAEIENNGVKSAERRLTLASDDDEDSETAGNHKYWNVLNSIFWTLNTVVIVVMLSIYILVAGAKGDKPQVFVDDGHGGFRIDGRSRLGWIDLRRGSVLQRTFARVCRNGGTGRFC